MTESNENKVTPREAFSLHDEYKSGAAKSGTVDLKSSGRKEIRRGAAPNKTKKSKVQFPEPKSKSK